LEKRTSKQHSVPLHERGTHQVKGETWKTDYFIGAGQGKRKTQGRGDDKKRPKARGLEARQKRSTSGTSAQKPKEGRSSWQKKKERGMGGRELKHLSENFLG